MTKSKLITVKEDIKDKLDEIKLCQDESYNSVLARVLPKWAEAVLGELNKKEEKSGETSQNGESKT